MMFFLAMTIFLSVAMLGKALSNCHPSGIVLSSAGYRLCVEVGIDRVMPRDKLFRQLFRPNKLISRTDARQTAYNEQNERIRFHHV